MGSPATEAPVRTLEEFEQQVRSVAIRVAEENDWCDGGLNDVLRELGLPEKKIFYVPVRINGEYTYQVPVNDVQSEEEARASVAADPERTIKYLGYHYGGYVKSFQVVEPPAQPDPESGVPLKGQPCPEEGEFYATSTESGGPNQCRVRGVMSSDVYCTRPLGHTADWHVAAGKNAGVLEVWPAEEGDKRPDPR